MKKKTFWQWFATGQRISFVAVFISFMILWFGINLGTIGSEFWSSLQFKVGAPMFSIILLVFVVATYKEYRKAKREGGVS